MAILCAKQGLVKHSSSVRPLLKIIFLINIPFFIALLYAFNNEWNNHKNWVFIGVLFFIGYVKDYCLTFLFLPKRTDLKIIQKRYVFIFVVTVSVLMMFLLPAPNNYYQKTYVSEGLAISTGAKLVSAEFYEKHKRFPKSNAEVGLPNPSEITGNAVKSIEIREGGVIKITYNEKLQDNAVLTIKGSPDQDKIRWECVKNDDAEITLHPDKLPASCRMSIYPNEKRV